MTSFPVKTAVGYPVKSEVDFPVKTEVKDDHAVTSVVDCLVFCLFVCLFFAAANCLVKTVVGYQLNCQGTVYTYQQSVRQMYINSAAFCLPH